MRNAIARVCGATERFARNVAAVTAVEFSLLAAPFFLLLFAILGTAVAFIGELTLDNAVARVGRQIRTGEMAQSEMTANGFRKALCEAAVSLFDCSKLMIDVKTYEKYSDLPKGPPLTGSEGKKTLDTSKFGFSAGQADKIMAVQVYYEMPILIAPLQAWFSGMNSGSFLVGSVFAFKTEPFNEQ